MLVDFLRLVMGVVTVNHMRGDKPMEKSRDGLDSSKTTNETAHHDKPGCTFGDPALDEVLHGLWQRAIKG